MPMKVPASVGLASATTIPATCPRSLISGPPELPGLTAASNWMSPAMSPARCRVSTRSRAETTPLVVVAVSPSGLPTATTSSPTARPPPSTAGTSVSGSFAGARVAMSCRGSLAETVAADSVPSAKVSLTALAPSTTWNAVSTVPSALTITPVPVAVVSESRSAADRPPVDWISTTEGRSVR
jgi:hypothetical protein